MPSGASGEKQTKHAYMRDRGQGTRGTARAAAVVTEVCGGSRTIIDSV